ncbi:hypothetical protein C1H46_004264 [Malus baccata]|uniref:Pentacotripeptide-repeat region of PRORP domain-containing protein n=1 Tax=Malus baccata TaxID=106549 RepID=A0A540NGC9_MALBA|nr:hypothetical protein C1H46_004264 [Malus baccata]
MGADLGFKVCLEEIGDRVEVALEKKEVIWRCGLTSGDWPLVRRRDADIAVCEGVNLAKKKKRDKLIDGCGKVESREVERKKVIGIFELMKYYKFKVGVDTINCLLDTQGRAKLVKEMQLLFEKLKERFTPNLQTFTALLNGWRTSKNLMKVGRVWNEMVDKGFKHDIVAHNTMLGGLLRGHKRSDAIKLFKVMKAKGPSPNVRRCSVLIQDFFALLMGYNALIKVMTRQQRMPDDAVRIYKKMIQNGIKPSIHIYNMIMKFYFQTRNYHIGRAVWDEMIQKGFCPDDNSYTVLIGGLINQGRSGETCKYLEGMVEK